MIDPTDGLCYPPLRMRYLKPGLLAAAIVALASLIVAAYSGARNRGLQTHCKNNLRFLGERAAEVIREAHLNPYRPEYVRIASGEARGREFWVAVHEVKLRNKGRDLSPYECPFVDATKASRSTESTTADRAGTPRGSTRLHRWPVTGRPIIPTERSMCFF